ncbi:MAG: hypothetical protein KDA92_15735, partial [Planctomycetales bacterium]|nr:hypothetical protein [Planctomycetales bacterium]
NNSFNYGTNQDFGAMGHWGDAFDIGWSRVPKSNVWHHLAYTYDGSMGRLYVDGKLDKEKDTTGLDIAPTSPIAIGAQWQLGGLDLDLSRLGSLAIGRVRVHDDVLSGSQIETNYLEEMASFVSPPPPPSEPLAAAPVHRYDFNNAAGTGLGATITDQAGDADGMVIGEGVTFTGSQVSLPGGTSDVAPYIDLPNGIISSLTDATFEMWVTVEGATNTPRFFSFGSTVDGELDEPGGGGADQDVISFSVTRGGNLGRQNTTIKNADEATLGGDVGDVGALNSFNTTVPTYLDEEMHLAIVYDSDGGTDGGAVIKHYRNGELVATSSPVEIALASLNDVNNWIGRSNNAAENNFQGSFDEFRIYDYALNLNQILGNIGAGPNVVNVGGGLAGDYNGDGQLDASDLDLQAAAIASPTPDLNRFDENNDGVVSLDDRGVWLHDLRKTWFGDADLNGVFDTGDMVLVFTKGKYETGEAATWEEGDWDADGVFSSGDLVAAFSDGGYEQGPRGAVSAVPEPSGLLMLLLGTLPFFSRRRAGHGK